MPQEDALSLRDARHDELQAVEALLRDAYAGYARHFSPGVWDAYRAEIGDVRARLAVADLVVAVAGADLVGTVTFYPDASLDGHGWPPGASSFRLLAVRPDARGSGAARALVDECIRRAGAAGASTLGLHTAPFMDAAIALYGRMGFTRAPEHDFDSDDLYTGSRADSGGVVGLAYVLPLAPGPTS